MATPSSPRGSPLPSAPESEVLFLALHHLHRHTSQPGVRPALAALESALSSAGLLPTRLDYTGVPHALAYPAAAARVPHLAPDYLHHALSTRLPPGARTLFATGRHLSAPRKRPRAPCLDAPKRRRRPCAANVFTLVDLQMLADVPMPLDRASFALLPKSFRRLKRLVGHHLPVFTTLFARSSRLLLTGSDDNLVKIWSADTAYLQHTLRGHDSDITDIVKHPTRSLVVSASSDSTLRAWDLDSGAALHVLDGGSKEVNAVQFSPCPDRPYLVSGGADGSVRLWNADQFSAGCMRIPIPQRAPRARCVAATSSDTRNALGRPSAVATSRTLPPSPVAEQLLPPASQPTPFSVNDIPAPALMPSPSEPASATAAALSPPQPQLAPVQPPPQTGASSAPRQMAEHSAPRHPTASSIAANSMVSGAQPSYGVLSVGFNAGATRLAVGGTDGNVYLYAVESADNSDSAFPQIRLLTTLRGHSDHIIQVLFSRSGDSIVTACRDGTARIWNRTKARLPMGKKGKQSVAGMGKWSSMTLDCRSQIQADARSALSGAASGSACGSIIPRMRRPIFPVSVDAAMWSLTDKYVFTASSDAKIRMWDSETGKLIRMLEAHEREVYVMDCHPMNERILLSAGYDGKCVLWDIETGKQLRTFVVGDDPEDPPDQSCSFGSAKRPSVTDGQFASDGLSFVLSDTSGAITIFGVGSVEATALAPVEQFFSKDCAAFQRDAQNRAVDEDTGLLLHLVPKGRLCDKDLRPHPPELQPNLPLSSPPKERGTTEDNSGNIVTKASCSPNVVENKNRDALMLRAKEFRENQEKEERRLLREAREARRRMVLEKEKADLEKDLMPASFQLRDFEVPDSDCDDSDEDFDGEVDQEPSDSSSSSSSEEEDEVRPISRSRRFRRRAVLSSEDEDEIRPVRVLRGRKLPDKREHLRRGRGIEKRRWNKVRSRRTASNGSEELGESELDAGDESPGYELGSQDTDSENSGTSNERKASCQDGDRSEPRVTGSRSRKSSSPEDRNALMVVEMNGSASAAKLSPSVSKSQIPVLALAGASASEGRRRMKINIQSRSPVGPSFERVQSTSGLQDSARAPAVESRSQPNDTAMTARNVAASSCDGRGQASEAGGFMGLHTPRNPSFTSERMEGKNVTTIVERSSKAAEDHLGDTASFVRPRRNRAIVEDGSALAPAQVIPLQQQSSSRSKLGLDSGVKSDTMNEVSDVHKAEANEKSLLSDSPARLTRKRLRSRTRNGVVRNEKREYEEVEEETPMIDIDFLAQRELRLLDSQTDRKPRKRIREGHPRSVDYLPGTRNKRRRLSASEESDGEQTRDEDGERRARKSDRDEAVHIPRRTMRKKYAKSRVPMSKDEACEDGSEVSKRLSASAWLRASSNRYTYVPQLGDDVMYFAEGHRTAMKVSREAGFDPLAGHGSLKKAGKQLLDGTSFAPDAGPVRFQIVDISYEFPNLPFLFQSLKPRSQSSKGKAVHAADAEDPKSPKIVAVLTLRFISGMIPCVGRSDRFVISYYPIDAPEFLVLSSRVNAALSRSWKASDRFRILFLNERRAWQYYMGTIRSVKRSIKSVMWNTVEVEYDNESEKEKATCEYVSPWELELEACDMPQVGKEIPLQYFHSYRSSTVDPGLLPVIAREFETIREIESNWRVQLSWLDTVDTLATLPGYCDKVPCPMDFNTVLVRLCTGYYRHFCSFIHDIILLRNNAILFHGADSEIGKLSVNIYTRLAETAERARVQYQMSYAHNIALSQAASQVQFSSRAIRPRPAQSEMTQHIPTPMGMANGVRQFPVPLTPRQSSGVGFAMPAQFLPEGMVPSAQQQRPWGGARTYLNNVQGQIMHGSHSLGVALPPAVPGMPHTGSVTRGSRASRVVTRAQQAMRRNNHAQARKGNAGSATRGNLDSTARTGLGNVPHPTGMVAHNLAVPFVPQSLGQISQLQPGQVTMVANSSHTNGNHGAARKLAPSSALSNPQGVMKQSAYAGASQARSNGRTAEAGNLASSRGHGTSGVLSPLLDGGVGLNGVSMTQPLLPQAAMRHQNRGMSTHGDGGTHSWGRSMEGAGGNFPLQASTSESHLPQVQNGRSPSPTSPSQFRNDGGVHAARAQTVTRGTGTAPYHEHSTISIAAASTMSCGGADVGADVAIQAATAESAEVVATQRSRDVGQG